MENKLETNANTTFSHGSKRPHCCSTYRINVFEKCSDNVQASEKSNVHINTNQYCIEKKLIWFPILLTFINFSKVQEIKPTFYKIALITYRWSWISMNKTGQMCFFVFTGMNPVSFQFNFRWIWKTQSTQIKTKTKIKSG